MGAYKLEQVKHSTYVNTENLRRPTDPLEFCPSGQKLPTSHAIPRFSSVVTIIQSSLRTFTVAQRQWTRLEENARYRAPLLTTVGAGVRLRSRSSHTASSMDGAGGSSPPSDQGGSSTDRVKSGHGASKPEEDPRKDARKYVCPVSWLHCYLGYWFSSFVAFLEFHLFLCTLLFPCLAAEKMCRKV